MNKRNLFLYAALTALSVSATAQTMNVTRDGDTTIVKIAKSPKYLLLPIEEGKDEAQVILDNGKKTDTWMDVRLAQGKTDYYVPFKLNKGKTSIVKILNLKEDALTLKRVGCDQYRFLSSLLSSHSFLRMDERSGRYVL